MNRKNIALTGLLVLVVLCCIFVAGCTTPLPEDDTAEQNNTLIAPPLSGTWSATNTEGNSIVQYTHIFSKDGTGIDYELYNNKLLLSIPFTWQQTGNVVDVMYGSGDDGKFVYTGKNGVWKDADGDTYTNTADASDDYIVGTWVNRDTENGTPATHLRVFKWDGTGMDLDKIGTGSVTVTPFTWKNTDNSYKVTFTDRTTATLTLNKADNALICRDDSSNREQKMYKDLLHTPRDSVLGTWAGYHVIGDTYLIRVVTFGADGTGTELEESPDSAVNTLPFTWKKDGTRHQIIYGDGTTDVCIYEENDDSLNYSDGTFLKKLE